MARKIYCEEELNEEWKEAREKAIERGMALGHSKGSQRNDRMLSLYVACEFQDLGVLRPEDITQELFLEWKDHVMSDLNRSGKGITENGFKKRKEAFLLIMRANKLQDQTEIGEMHKQRIGPSEFSFWDDETLEQMTVRAMEIFDNEPKKRAAAIAHMIHSDCPPRREDTARMRWSYFDFKDGKLLFPARKNGERPGNFIDERFIPYFRRWKEETSRYPDGDDLVFPSSMAQRSGTKASGSKRVTGKTVAKWLAYVRDTTTLANGERPLELSSQKYRHSFCMKAFAQGCTPRFVSKVLGDSYSTIERYYSRYMLDEQHRKESERMRRKSSRITSEGTVQPPRLFRHNRPLPSALSMALAEGFGLYEEGGGRWGI